MKVKSSDRVSKKFYADIDSRVRGAISQIGCGYDVYLCVRIVIDRYISAGIEPELSELITVRMIFALLKPEIDKAMMRSRLAKERAAARRSTKTGDDLSHESPAVIPDDPGEDMTAVEPASAAATSEVEPATATVASEIEPAMAAVASEVEPVTAVITEEMPNTTSTAAASEDLYMLPLNRRARRARQRKLRKAKKRTSTLFT